MIGPPSAPVGRHLTPLSNPRATTTCVEAVLVSDFNRNRTAVRYDALGLLVVTALMSKPEESLGYVLDTFTVTLSDDTVARFVVIPGSIGKNTPRQRHKPHRLRPVCLLPHRKLGKPPALPSLSQSPARSTRQM